MKAYVKNEYKNLNDKYRKNDLTIIRLLLDKGIEIGRGVQDWERYLFTKENRDGYEYVVGYIKSYLEQKENIKATSADYEYEI